MECILKIGKNNKINKQDLTNMRYKFMDWIQAFQCEAVHFVMW
jgi:hypothetical protein